MPNYRHGVPQNKPYDPNNSMDLGDFRDTAYRGLASALGSPVDILSSAMRPFGYGIPEQDTVMSSEWLGKQFEDMGLVSQARNPVSEFIGAMMIPDPTDIATMSKFLGATLVPGMAKHLDDVPTEKLGLLERKRLEKAQKGIPEGRRLYHPERDKHYIYNKDTDTVYFETPSGKYIEMPNDQIRSDIKYIDENGVSAFRDKLKGISAEDKRIADDMARAEADMLSPDSYKMQHTAPTSEYGASGDRLQDMFPEDIYSPNAQRLYGHGDVKMDNESLDVIHKIRDNPDAEVEIYRAIPKDINAKINDGDWVTTSKEYAKVHGEGPLNGNYKILKKKVKAKDIFTDGNSIHEWGYSPQK